MRILVFILIFCASLWSMASEPVSGLLQKDGRNYFMKLEGESSRRYKVVATSRDVAENLRKLSAGDAITGKATLNDQAGLLLLQSIDYVGIRRLLGTWYSPAGMFEVTNFENLKFYPHPEYLIRQGIYAAVISRPREYHYSMTPMDGKEWVLFLSDNWSTTFATIQISQGKARLKMYDSETGAVTSTLRLIKWGSQ